MVHVVTLSLTFRGAAKLFPGGLHHFTIPAAMYAGASLSTSSPAPVTTCAWSLVTGKCVTVTIMS